jgi:hypothetical protein
MVNIKTLLPDLKKLVQGLNEDLLMRATENAEIDAGLRGAFSQIVKGGRTAQAFEVWREDYLDQVAVAWVLACVFVRFMEDNHLIDECWLAGEGERRRLAEDTHELFFRKHPHDTDREYFHHVFHEVEKIPAARDLFAEGKTPLWALSPSGDAAMKLLAFWREIDAEEGHLKRSFEVEGGDTRFLGDLYQELSEKAKKKYALLQTPVFVEEFILNRTLNPAIDEFGLDTVRMIDPACGSGHFLLGGFARLFDLWMKRENNEIVAAQKALDGIWGVDINPFAVAIARFRLIVAALVACGIKRLKDSPGWGTHLATGDSLLFGSRWNRSGDMVQEQAWFATDEGSWAPKVYACEDKEALEEVLGQQYHAVVGNPPYISVKDSRLNEAYRGRYSTCHRQYSLAVPFTERFFDLALSQEGSCCGYVGMITANSFMKREFGKKLIEGFFPAVDLTHVIDTSGAYIPGHGTPTVILLGRNRRPVAPQVRAVLGIRGEPTTPDDPARGLVWQSIADQVENGEAQNEFVSVTTVDRAAFSKHPWSIGGGGAAELKASLDDAAIWPLSNRVTEIGRTTHTGEDEVYYLPLSTARTCGLKAYTVPLVTGEDLRDWGLNPDFVSLFPYDLSNGSPVEIESDLWMRHFWKYRRTLKGRMDFGNYIEDRGLRWYDHSMFFPERYRARFCIAFPYVFQTCHFVIDRGGKVFKQSAPIMKLQPDASEDEHYFLLGILNASTSCYWFKQVCPRKGSSGIGRGVYDEAWEVHYSLDGARLEYLPIVANHQTVVAISRELDALAAEVIKRSPSEMIKREVLTAERLETSRAATEKVQDRMVVLQEELDWLCYRLYGLTGGDDKSLERSMSGDELPGLNLGERAFEIVMARRIAAGELETSWFARHDSTPVTEIPGHWPEAYQTLVQRRLDAIRDNPNIALIERPEYKRRWLREPWDDHVKRALRSWLFDRLENTNYHRGTANHPELSSTAQLADQASGDHLFLQVATIYRGRPDFDVAALVSQLVENESVPFLPVLRYKPTGMRKREVWERTWDLQRKEDGGEDVGDIPVPPKYTSADFLKQDYWRLRGKLDVPKERWISYPYLQTESDPSLVVGWAGWDYVQQAAALVSYYDTRRREGWDAKRLTPILAGLDQLLSWIHQWHPEIDPEFGDTAGQSYQSMLEHDAHELGLTLEEIRKWQPPQTTRRRARV